MLALACARTCVQDRKESEISEEWEISAWRESINKLVPKAMTFNLTISKPIRSISQNVYERMIEIW